MIYILLGPILLMAGTILLFYTFINYRKTPATNRSGQSQKKKSHIIECEKCSKKLRVPTVPEALNVTCPECKNKFTHG